MSETPPSRNPSRKPTDPGKSPANDGPKRAAAADPGPVPGVGAVEFEIVGIGASAGGLEAIQAFFERLPDRFPHAIIIVQHLSPDHKSLMGEILARFTRLRIRDIKNNMVIEPATVYLIPPKKIITIRNGRFVVRVKPARKHHDPSFPIDIFFSSLARERGRRSLGVVLSGTGSDGTRGARSIREAGGMIIAQQPETAKFDGMPRSVITEGLASMILPIDRLADELVELLSHPEDVHNEVLQSLARDEEMVLKVMNQVRLTTGVDFSPYKRTTLLRRLAQRVRNSGAETASEYLERAESLPNEIRLLAQDFLIGVTRFFRDAESWQALSASVIPSIVKRHSEDDPIRVWVAGCSSGEEAYTVAMLFREAIEASGRPVPLKVFATDIVDAVLDTATKGRYPLSIATDIPRPLLEKYFRRTKSAYICTESLRRSIIFAKHNLLEDPPFRNLDFISCRNMLIYLQPKYQRRALTRFHYGLAIKGVMMLGSSESLGDLQQYFGEINRSAKLYRKTVDGRPGEAGGLAFQEKGPEHRDFALMSAAPSPPAPSRAPAPSVLTEAILETLGATCLFINTNYDILNAWGHFKRYLDLPDHRFSFNLQKMVPENMSVAISTLVFKARKSRDTVRYAGLKLVRQREVLTLDLIVQPLVEDSGQVSSLLVYIVEQRPALPEDEGMSSEPITAEHPDTIKQVADLEEELRFTKENLQATIEELETSNEELQAINEELVASNEELQSTNEELHSVNEELHSVNSEHQYKIQELLALNADIDNLLRSTEIATVFLDRELRIRKFTPAIRSHLRLLETDIGRPIDNFKAHMGDVDVEQDAQHVVDTGHIVTREIRTRDQQWFLYRACPFITEDGKIDGAVITIVNIDQLKAAESELRRQRNLYESIINQASNGIFVVDRDLNPIIINDAAARLNGMGKEALPPERWHHQYGAFRPDRRTVFPMKEYPLSKAIQGEICYGVEMFLRNPVIPEGRMIKVNAAPLHDESGAISGAIAVFDDITRQKEAAEALAASEERFRRVFENGPLGMAFFDPYLRFSAVNDRLCDITGYPESALVSQSTQSLTHPEDWPALKAALDRLMNGDEQFITADTRYLTREGRPVWVELTVTLLDLEAAGAPVGFIMVADIDARKRMQAELNSNLEKLRMQNAELEQFAFVASHDLREPLNTIENYVGLLGEQYADGFDADGRKMMHFIVDASRRMKALVLALLDYSRLNGRERSLERVNCQAILADTLDDLRDAIAESGARVEWDTPLPEVDGHAASLRRLFQNLISNAIKFHRPDHKPLVRVEWEAHPTEWEFAIRDDGIGIDPKHSDDIFVIFKRLHTHSEYQGTGLGLALCRKIVDIHGGRIWVESRPGRGAVFRFTLPKAREEGGRADA